MRALDQVTSICSDLVMYCDEIAEHGPAEQTLRTVLRRRDADCEHSKDQAVLSTQFGFCDEYSPSEISMPFWHKQGRTYQ